MPWRTPPTFACASPRDGGRLLLFVNPVPYLPDQVGGSERSTHALCAALAARGVPVAVLARAGAAPPEGSRANRWGTLDEGLGYPVYRVRDVTGAIAAIAESVHAATVIAQNEFSLASAALAAGFPTLLYLRHADPAWLFARARVPPDAELAHPLLGYVANSDFVRRFYEQRFGFSAEVVTPLVLPEDYRVRSTRERVLFVNPVPVKGVEIALALAAARPDIPFDFVEAWPLSEAEFAQLEQRCGALGNVTLRRALSDMRALYGRAKLLLVPSLWEEAWARVVVEAQVSGIPALASRRGGLPENVGAGGIVVDAEAGLAPWRAALSRLWDDDAAYAACAEAARAEGRRPERDPSRIVDRFLDLATRHGARRAAPAKGIEDIGLSVIVPTFRRPEGLARLLAALRGQIAGTAKRELIVVNDGTHDDAYARLAEQNSDIVRYVAAPANCGPAAARNLGARHAGHEFFVFIDDDCVPPPYWLDWLASVLAENPELDVVSGTTRPLPAPRPKLFQQFLVRAGFHPRPYLLVEHPVLISANLAVRRVAFERVAGFDETMRTTEDRNLGYRLRLRGAMFHLDDAWFVYHDMTSSPASHFRRYYRYGKGVGRELALEHAPPDRGHWPPDARPRFYWWKRARTRLVQARTETDRRALGRFEGALFTGLNALTRLSLDLGFARGAAAPARASEAPAQPRKPLVRGGKIAQRFLIFALARTGSTSLMRALECHPEIAVANEPFGPGPAIAQAQTRAELLRALDAIAADFNGIKHIGNFMGWPPFANDPALQLELLNSFGPVLLLRRSNILRRLVSSEIARQSGIFQSAAPPAEYRHSLLWFPFRRLDEDRIALELGREADALDRVRRHLAASGIRSLDLAYEDLFAPGDVEERVSRVEPIFQFLGASAAELGPEARGALAAIVDPALNKLNDLDMLWRIPGITEIEARFGSDATGWLFR